MKLLAALVLLADLTVGQTALQEGDYAKAEAEFKKVIKANPKSPDAEKAWVNLGLIAFTKDDIAGALAAYDSALALKSNDSKALNGRATALMRLGRMEESILAFESAAKANPKDPLPFFNLGYIALRSNQLNAAEGLFGLALQADPGSPDAHAGMAEIYLVRADYKMALKEAQISTRSNPKHVGGLMALGKAYIGLDRYADAAEPLAKAAELAPGTDAEIPFTYGIALYNERLYAKAGMAFADALDLEPNDPQIHLWGGLAFYQLGNVDAAAEEFQHTVDLGAEGRDRAMAIYHMALIVDDEGDMKQAESLYREALKADPKYALAANNLGLLLQRSKRLADAVTEYRRALSADPEMHIARLNLGHALLLQGLKTQARAELSKVRDRLPPGHELRVKAEQLLANN